MGGNTDSLLRMAHTVSKNLMDGVAAVRVGKVGLTLHYARRGVQGGGHIRDSQGDTYKCKVNGTQYRCDNWLPIFAVKLP